MSLLLVVLVIVAVGVLLYAVKRWVPMDPEVRSILTVVVIVLLVVWLMKAVGLWDVLMGVKV